MSKLFGVLRSTNLQNLCIAMSFNTSRTRGLCFSMLGSEHECLSWMWIAKLFWWSAHMYATILQQYINFVIITIAIIIIIMLTGSVIPLKILQAAFLVSTVMFQHLKGQASLPGSCQDDSKTDHWSAKVSGFVISLGEVVSWTQRTYLEV